MFEIRVHGLGGQGAVTLCTWIAQAGYAVDKHVQAFPFFGAERRGAPVKAFVRISDEPIDLRCQIYRPDLLVVMSPDLSGLALKEGISPGGRFLLNAGSELALRLEERFARDIYYLDATQIAIDLGLEIDGMPMVNLPLLGATMSQIADFSFDVVMDVVDEVAAKRGNRDAYEEATKRGFEGVRRVTVEQKVP